MKRWYTFFTGKKMLGMSLAATVVLTAFMAINFYNGKDSEFYENTKESSQAFKEETKDEKKQVAEEMNHELPIGSEVGKQELADANVQESISQENPSEEIVQVAGQTSIVSMNLNFDESAKLQWPISGREVIKPYSMDSLVYYPTLEEYKVCPAIMVQAEKSDAVMAPADCVVSEIGANEEIGNYICLKLSEQYDAVIGNLENILVKEGEYLLKGTLLGGVAAPTKYYLTEGANLYFELQRDGQPIDPLDYLE